MIIQIFQSGGLAGEEETSLGQVDTSKLPPREQERIRELAKVIEKPPKGAAPIGADMLKYRVQIQPDAGPGRTVVIEDDMNPGNPVLRSVHELAELIAKGS